MAARATVGRHGIEDLSAEGSENRDDSKSIQKVVGAVSPVSRDRDGHGRLAAADTTMNRRTFLLGTGGTAIAAGGIIGSSAFTSVNADRVADVQVVGDESAYLQLEPTTEPNGDYAAIGTDGALELQMELVNPLAESNFEQVFTVTNNGNQDVGVWFEPQGDNPGLIDFTDNDTGDPLDDDTAPVTIAVGNSVTVDIFVDTSTVGDGTEIIDELTIIADADEAAP